MDAFEKRAQADHLSPEEVAKTYEQMSKLLNADNSKSVVKAPERALLAEGLMHQIAFPSDTDQGVYNTCNVTTVAEKTMTKNPSKAAEMVATTALTGQWTAADGKVIKIDPGSLTPGVQESVDPHVENTRSYATQVLNLVMANDALQRRVPPETYVQRKPDHSVPGDSGERRLDASGHEIKTMQWDPKNDTWKSLPDDSPALTDHEIAQVGARLNGHENHLISPGNGQSGVDDVRGVEQFEARLHQFQQQGEFPITINVDGNHAPIPVGNETPGIGNHVVTIDGYDENTHEVHISNQWGVASDKWVAVKDLYNNSKTVHPLDDDSNQDH
jgi:hypothetical protein